MNSDNESVFDDNNKLREEFDQYDRWLMEGNPDIKKDDLKHEIYFDSCSFILDDQTMKLYDVLFQIVCMEIIGL